VDEAETGLKSALAVKIFGSDLNLLADKAAQVKDILARTPGITEITVVKETGSQPDHHSRPRQAGALWADVSDINTSSEPPWAASGHAGDSGRTPVRPGGAHAGAVPQRRKRHRNLLISTPDGQYLPLSQFCDIKWIAARR